MFELDECYVNRINSFAHRNNLFARIHYNIKLDEPYLIRVDFYTRAMGERIATSFIDANPVNDTLPTIPEQISGTERFVLGKIKPESLEMDDSKEKDPTYTIIVRYKNSGETCEKINNVMDFHIDDHICTINISEDERAVIPLCNVLKISSVVDKEETEINER